MRDLATALAVVFSLALVASSASALNTRVSAPLPASADVKAGGWALSSDGEWVVYLADADADEQFELYAVPEYGGDPVKLNGPLFGGQVVDFAIAPNSESVVFRQSGSVAENTGLFAVGIDGANLRVLSVPVVAADYVITPDSAAVVYRTAADPESPYDLVASALTNPVVLAPPIELSAPLAPVGSVVEFRYLPDSALVVFLAEADAIDRLELFAAPITGGVVSAVSAPLTAGRVKKGGWNFTQDESRITYIADAEQTGIDDLYAASLDTGDVSHVSSNIEFSSGGGVVDFQTHDVLNRNYFRAQETADQPPKMHFASVFGGFATAVNGTFVAGGGFGPAYAPADTNRLFLTGDLDALGRTDLYRLQSSSLIPPARVTAFGQPLGDVESFQADEDECTVVVAGDLAIDGVQSLFFGCGTPSTHLTPDLSLLVGTGVEADYRADFTQERVYYRAAMTEDPNLRLYSSALGNSFRQPQRVSSGLAADSSVVEYQVAPGGNSAAFLADTGADGQFELWRSDIPSTCCAAGDTGGCDDGVCEACVCGLDPSCCSSSPGWSESCVQLARVDCPADCTCSNACDVGGDLNLDGTLSIPDVQCVILVALWEFGHRQDPRPACIGDNVDLADFDCDAGLDVLDVQLLILTNLETLPSSVDSNQNGCVDTCE